MTPGGNCNPDFSPSPQWYLPWKSGHIFPPPRDGGGHLCVFKLHRPLEPSSNTSCFQKLVFGRFLPLNNAPRPCFLWNSPLYGMDTKMAALVEECLGAAIFPAQQRHSWTTSGLIHNCTWFRVSRPQPLIVRKTDSPKGQWQGWWQGTEVTLRGLLSLAVTLR